MLAADDIQLKLQAYLPDTHNLPDIHNQCSGCSRTYAGRNTVQSAVHQLQSVCNDKMLCAEDKATVTCEVCVR